MATEKTKPPEEAPSEEFTRFERMARALFRVNKQDVSKNELVKRAGPASSDNGGK